MRLPSESSAPAERVSFGRYVLTRLKRAKYDDLAVPVDVATRDVKAAARSWEDAAEPIQEAIALRDAADDTLDDTAQQARLTLSSRSLDATQQAPYTAIFPKGIDYYISAGLPDEAQRYTELTERLEKNLAGNDDVRVATVPVIAAGVKEFSTAMENVAKARTAEALAKTHLDAAEEAWGMLMERTYGALVSRVGRKKAERFFPRRKRAQEEETPVGGVPVGGTPPPG